MLTVRTSILLSSIFFVTVTFAQKNAKPEIVGQFPLSTNENAPITIQLSNLVVTDPDNKYPDDFTLKLSNGKDYDLQGSTVTPHKDFHGTIKVPVTVNDGQDESKKFDLKIQVNEVEEVDNVRPIITGQQTLSISVGEKITIQFSYLVVFDPDNNYPEDFTLKVSSGKNYKLDGETVTPDANFKGTLTVQVQVKDGEDESEKFNLKIEVKEKVSANIRPVITGQDALSTNEGQPITIQLNDLNVTDPDNAYPQDFTLKVSPGPNYTADGQTVTPKANFKGNLTVPVTVHDGKDESKPFNLKIEVKEKATGNIPPIITGQDALATNEGQPIVIQLNNLNVTDPDNAYPQDFTLKVSPGQNYSVDGQTVTPNPNFKGNLTVAVTVHDGKDESKPFNLKIEVKKQNNIRPIITGQVALSTNEGQSITIQLTDLIVTDPDNEYPKDFTLKISPGQNYSVDGQTVTPNTNFKGSLTVVVAVRDGKDESEKFNLKIEVKEPGNARPIIVGQDALSVSEGQGITIQLGDLNVTDADNEYPEGFTLKIPNGNGTNYTVSGNKITPAQNFSGTLDIAGVTVNDGKSDSEPYVLHITVTAVNDAPVITGQNTVTGIVNTPITVALTSLKVTDPDNAYPGTFTMEIAPGFNYVVAGAVITPAPNFTGTLKARVTVNDGIVNSNSFELQIRVIAAANVAPVITGQKTAIAITVNNPLEIQLSHLTVTDPDNLYPADFRLTVLTGASYALSGTTITPSQNFTGTLTVRVSVNDGTASSNIFNLKVSVIPITSIPQIIGQKALMMNEDGSITIELTDLIVSDADDTYPLGFSLQVLADPENHYAVKNNNTVTPSKNLNGFLTVGITVTDNDKNSSAPFNLAILITPVNDPPVITQFETSPLPYEPGTDPIALTSIFEVEDVDNDHLSFAEISIKTENYSKGFDELQFVNTANISGVFDVDGGKLSLVGYATLSEYREAIRSITYNYRLSEDENGNQMEIRPGTKTISLHLHDGQQMSEDRLRDIIMEVSVTLHIPNAFTPNGDGPNEIWNVNALTNGHQCDDAIIRVYNKNGLLLFQTVGLEKKWDGRYNGEVLPMDIYFYTIDLKLAYSKKTYKGVVTLLR